LPHGIIPIIILKMIMAALPLIMFHLFFTISINFKCWRGVVLTDFLQFIDKMVMRRRLFTDFMKRILQKHYMM